MAQQTMYSAQANSLQTELAAAIDATQTTITVLDGSVLPAAPNLLVIGGGEDAETVLYTGKTGNSLSGVTRGFQGVAKAWGSGVKVGRFFTAYDHDAFRGNISDHETRVSAAETKLSAATSAATANTLAQRDASGRLKAAAPSASDDVARKAETDAASAAAGAAQTTANNAQTRANAGLPKDGSEVMSGKLGVALGQLGTTAGNTLMLEDLSGQTSNGTRLVTRLRRITNGTTWESAAIELVKIVDATEQQRLVMEGGTGDVDIVPYLGGTVKANGQKIWHSGNDGPGSGLSADDSYTVRGYVPVNKAGDLLTGSLTINLEGGEKRFGFRNGSDTLYMYSNSDLEYIGVYGDRGGIGRSIWAYQWSSNTLDIADAVIRYRGNVMPVLRDNSGVLEFYTGGTWKGVGGIKKVQRGVTNISTPAAVSVSITAVDMEKSFVTISCNTAANLVTALAYGRLTSSTTLELARNLNTSVLTSVAWEVVEFY
ncbi:hypothetical protein [Paenibacillus sp. y28]|uniref:hypothetical protein n=1 Tax=Paenibacillus sp. y28 TaxID=3129110 RepID=UPI003019F43A